MAAEQAGPSINYPDANIPEFKSFTGVNKIMNKKIVVGKDVDLNFETISDFKWCMKCGGEVEFLYNGTSFSITHRQSGEIGISEAHKQETEKLCKGADEVLEYVIDGVRLRDIITEVKILMKTI